MKTELRRQLSVAIENEPGRLGAVARLLAAQGVHIDAFSIIDNIEHGMVRLMTDDPTSARAALKEAGFPVVEASVLAVEMTDRPGSLATIGEALSAAGVNIEYAYASTSRIGRPTRMILKTGRPERALEVLAGVRDEA